MWVNTNGIPFWLVGAPPILVYFSWDWDVHWGYGILTQGHFGVGLLDCLIVSLPECKMALGVSKTNPTIPKHKHPCIRAKQKSSQATTTEQPANLSNQPAGQPANRPTARPHDRGWTSHQATSHQSRKSAASEVMRWALCALCFVLSHGVARDTSRGFPYPPDTRPEGCRKFKRCRKGQRVRYRDHAMFDLPPLPSFSEVVEASRHASEFSMKLSIM